MNKCYQGGNCPTQVSKVIYVMLSNKVTYSSNRRHIEDSSNDWDSSEKINCYWKESTEENHKAIQLYTHAYDWPSQQHYEYTTKECPTAFSFMPLKEESERPL